MVNGDLDKNTILIIDNVTSNVAILKKIITDKGYKCIIESDYDKVVKCIDKFSPSLIIFGMNIPNKEGYMFWDKIKNNIVSKNIPVIFILSSNDENERIKAINSGACDYVIRPYDHIDVFLKIEMQIKIYNMQQEIKKKNCIIRDEKHQNVEEFEERNKKILMIIAKLAEDNNYIGTKQHQKNIAYNSRLLAQQLNLKGDYENSMSDSYIETLELGAAIHDIGKITVSKDILIKKQKLSSYEWEVLKTHTINGSSLINAICGNEEKESYVKLIDSIIRNHHENWDGTGYPDGLSGEDIPLAARIVHVVDSYDSMCSERNYRKAIERKKVLDDMKKERGKKYDPVVLDAFFEIEKDMKKPFNL